MKETLLFKPSTFENEDFLDEAKEFSLEFDPLSLVSFLFGLKPATEFLLSILLLSICG